MKDFLYNYQNKNKIEDTDRLTGVGADDFTYNFRMKDLADYIVLESNIQNINTDIIDLGVISGDILFILNNRDAYSIETNSITYIKRVSPITGSEIYLTTATPGRYGSGEKQMTTNDIFLIEKEYLSKETDPIYNSEKSRIAFKDEPNTFEETVTINGDLIVNGDKVIQHETDLYISDPILLLNDGEKGYGVSGRYSGIQTDRGQDNDYFAGIEENVDTSKTLYKVGQFDSTDGLIVATNGSTFTLQPTETIDFTGKLVRFTKSGEESKFGSITSYNNSSKIATLAVPLSGLDNTWTYRILYHTDLYPVALWDESLTDNAIPYWDASAMLLRDSGIKKSILDNLKPVATSGNYTDLINKPIIDSVVSDSSINAVQNKIVKKYIDDAVDGVASVVDLSLTMDGTSNTVSNTAGTGFVLNGATLDKAGLLQASDKVKLDHMGLIQVQEQGKLGFRTTDYNPSNYGVIGNRSVDLSYSDHSSTINGATGYTSFAEGLNTIASGEYSHAQNVGTIAGFESQTAIGSYNDNKQTSIFEIGNGTDTDNRSNALEVDWDGNVNIPTGASFKVGGIPIEQGADINGNSTVDFNAKTFKENGLSLEDKYALKNGDANNNFNANILSATELKEGNVSLISKYAKIGGDITQDFKAKTLTAERGTINLEKGSSIDFSDVKNVNIGGRNLLRDSKKSVNNANYIIANYDLAEKPLVGETYTLQIKGNLGVGKTRFLIYNSGGVIELGNISQKNANGIYTLTFEWKNKQDQYLTDDTFVKIYTSPSSVVTTSEIEWVKLEKGTVATDWTPAPEDLLLNYGDLISTKPDGTLQAVTLNENGVNLTSKYAKINGDVTQNFYAAIGLFSKNGTNGQHVRVYGDKIYSESGVGFFDLGLNYDKTILAKHDGTLQAKNMIISGSPACLLRPRSSASSSDPDGTIYYG